MADSSLEDFAVQQAQDDDLRRTIRTLSRQLARAKAKVDDLVEATIDAARSATLAQGPIPPVPAPKRDTRKRGAEVALWNLGDWQGAKLTSSYNSEVMRQRVMRFCEKAVRITEIQRADHPVRDCVIVFGGDMVEGLFNFPTQPYEIDASLFEQYVTVSRLLIDVVRSALATYEHVAVVAEWGNHGRVGSKRSAVPRSDNVDRMCYEFARSMLMPDPRLRWEDCPEDIQRLEVGNYRALVIHGDEIGRNGFASPATIVQHANRWRSGAYPWAFRDVYCHHYHRHAEEGMADGVGAVYWTGSTESDNRYARDTMASAGQPSQRLHFIDPVAGEITAQYRVRLSDPQP